jgi:hypothetical protein
MTRDFMQGRQDAATEHRERGLRHFDKDGVILSHAG